MALPSEKNEEITKDIAGKSQDVLEAAANATEDFKRRADALADDFRDLATNQPLPSNGCRGGLRCWCSLEVLKPSS